MESSIPLEDLSDAEWDAMSPLEKRLIRVIENVNNVARNWSDHKLAVEKIVDLTATLFEGKQD